MVKAVREMLDRLSGRLRESMDTTIMPWYQGLAVREQRLVALAAGMFFVLFLLFGIITPLHDKVATMRLEVAQLADQAREASRLADELQHNGSATGAQVDLLSAVEQVAVRTKVRSHMTRIHPQTGTDGSRQLALQLKSVPYTDVVGFVEALYHDHIGLQRLRMQAADHPGFVHVEAVASGA